MATGFIASNGLDLDAIFEPRGSTTKIPDVGYIYGTDISNRYMDRTLGGLAQPTGFKISGGADLSSRFALLGTGGGGAWKTSLGGHDGVGDGYSIYQWVGEDSILCRAGEVSYYCHLYGGTNEGYAETVMEIDGTVVPTSVIQVDPYESFDGRVTANVTAGYHNIRFYCDWWYDAGDESEAYINDFKIPIP